MAYTATLVHQLAPAVPYVVALCVLYLLANDVLDLLLAVKVRRASARVGWFVALRLVGFNGLVAAVVNDVANRQALTIGAGAALAAYTAGGDFRAQLVAALIGVCAANVGSLELSTAAKVRDLLSPVPAPPKPAARRAAAAAK